MKNNILNDANKILLFLILLFTGLYLASSFLIPVAYAIILAMLLLPLRKRFERAGIHRRWATLFCVLILFSVISLLIILVGRQVTMLYEDLPEIEKNALEKLSQFRLYLSESWNIPYEQQQKIINAFSLDAERERLNSMMTSFAWYMADLLLIFIYVFVFLYFKSHFERFVLKLTPGHNNPKAQKIMDDVSSVAERYLLGKLILMVFLGIIYATGFLIIGVEHALFYAVFAAVLSIIPYIGNIIGASLPFAMTLIEKDLPSALAVVGLFFVVQFIETYIFEPLIVGRNVNLNPPFSILIIVVGGAVWGISGMILAIPYLGILQIIFSYIEPLKPFGFLIGDTESESDDWIHRMLQKINSH